MNYPIYDHDQHARSVGRKDFRLQVKRQEGGVPLSDDQVRSIAAFVAAALSLDKSDTLLDIGCGNGELTSMYSSHCRRTVGIDPSKYMIEIAAESFSRDDLTFRNTDTLQFLQEVNESKPFTAVVFFASFQYLSEGDADRALGLLAEQPSVERILLGNLPDLLNRTRFADDAPRADPEFEHRTAIGRWLSIQEIDAMARTHGLMADVVIPGFPLVGSHYRFHALLQRSRK